MNTAPLMTRTSKKRADGLSIFPAGFRTTFLLTTTVFFVWGMSNNLTDILVQQFRKSFELNLLQAQLVQTANFLAYALIATPAALLTRRFGYKAGLVIGLVTFGVGTLLFWPAAIIGQYTPFLVAIFVVGGGASFLETAANPLIAQFGDPHTSEQRLNFAQSFNPPGTITGVLIGTWFIFSGVDATPAQVNAMKVRGTYAAYLHTEILRVVPTYVVLGVCVLSLAIVLSRAKFPASLDSMEYAAYPSEVAKPQHGVYGRLFRSRALVFAIIAMFFYVGAQVSIWSNLIPYVRAYTTLGDRSAGYWLTGTLVALGLGRIVSTPLMRYIHPSRMIGFYAFANLILLTIGITRPGFVGGAAIVVTSFFMSVMYPTIFALGVKGLGGDTKIGGSLLVMSIAGGAVFPPLVGLVARESGSLAHGFVVPAAAFVVIALYAFIVPRITESKVSRHSVEAAPQGL